MRKQILADDAYVLDAAVIGLAEPPEPDRMYLPALHLIRGGSQERDVPILKQQIIVGRGEESDIPIQDPTVSHQHLLLSCRRVVDRDGQQQFRVLLKDLGSLNGTLVNSRRVQRALLRSGDVIAVGQALLRFEYRDLADIDFYNQVRRVTTSDSLTSLWNRGTIAQILAGEITRGNRYGRALSILILDMDDFRSLNETHGQSLGDRVLKSVSRVLRRNLRLQDSAGRWGGEEFLIVQPETGLRGAALSGDRIRNEIEKIIAPALRLERSVTASIGVASRASDADSDEALLDRAYTALTRAKSLGKNRVETWSENPTEPDRVEAGPPSTG